MSSGVPVQYTASSEVTRADDGAQLAWGADGSLTTRTVGADVTTYASDSLGRRTSTTISSGDVTQFAWDQVGRMTGLSDTATDSQTDYTYSEGLRIGAATTVGAGTADEVTSTQSFTWDTLAGVPLLLSDGGHECIYGLGSSPVAQVDTATGDVVFLHGDLVGSTRTATDASGTVVGTWDYTPFGVTTSATGGANSDGVGVTRFLFAGEYQDESGLYFLRARFMDPVTASFLSIDPALSATGSPYAYASGNPLQLTDPLGLFSFSKAWDSTMSAVSSALDSTVDAVSSAASATGNWISDNKGMIIGVAAGILVTAGCLAITAGAGSVGCAALGGAVGNMVTYGIDTPKECWTAGGFFKSGVEGAVVGAAFGVAGKALAPIASKAVGAVASKASPAIRTAISKTATVLKPKSMRAPEVGGIKAGNCFVAGTGVLLADGSMVAIEDVKIGDLVETTDPATGKESAHAVTRLFRHDNAALFSVVIDGSTVTATPTHPFWVVGRGWVTVDELQSGDALLQPDDTTVTVNSVTATGKTATVYNFEVEEAHDYYVKAGDHWVLVHNTCEIDIDGIAHAASRHTWGGAKLDANASVFDNGADLAALAKGSNGMIGKVGTQGNIEYVVRAPEVIGVTGRTAANPGGIPTNTYTIVRDIYDGSLKTMHPGVS